MARIYVCIELLLESSLIRGQEGRGSSLTLNRTSIFLFIFFFYLSFCFFFFFFPFSYMYRYNTCIFLHTSHLLCHILQAATTTKVLTSVYDCMNLNLNNSTCDSFVILFFFSTLLIISFNSTVNVSF